MGSDPLGHGGFYPRGSYFRKGFSEDITLRVMKRHHAERDD